jgi:hypothetical protein
MDATAKLAPETIAHGPTKTSVRLANGLQVDVRVVKPVEFGAFMDALRQLGAFWAVLNEVPRASAGSVRVDE